MFKFFKKTKKEPRNFKEVLAYCRKLEERIEEVSKNLEEVKKLTDISVKKVGLIRFNPFKDMGGDQSFSIALLDSENNGLVISSIYSREGSRIYAKSVKNGDSEYQLSEEEKEAIEKAIKA